MIHFCVWSQISSTEISQILIDPMAAWDNLMVIALACEQISDSFCFIKNWSLRSQKQERFQNCPRIQALFRFVFLSFQALQSCRRIWQTWPRSWIAARASPFWSTNSLSHARSSPRWENLFFPAIWFRLAHWQYDLSQEVLIFFLYMSHSTFFHCL